jgi:hypothetical protein
MRKPTHSFTIAAITVYITVGTAPNPVLNSRRGWAMGDKRAASRTANSLELYLRAAHASKGGQSICDG